MDPWVQTWTGRRVDLLNPDPEAIVIKDIAYSLARQHRYNGHTDRPWTVADHSVLVSTIIDDHTGWGLMHDAAEAYTGDIVSPMKRIPGVREIIEGIEDGLIVAIASRFGLPIEFPDAVHIGDEQALAIECHQLMGGERGGDWCLPRPAPNGVDVTPLDYAANREIRFMNRFREVVGA